VVEAESSNNHIAARATIIAAVIGAIGAVLAQTCKSESAAPTINFSPTVINSNVNSGVPSSAPQRPTAAPEPKLPTKAASSGTREGAPIPSPTTMAPSSPAEVERAAKRPDGCVDMLVGLYVRRTDGSLIWERDPSRPQTIIDATTGRPLTGIVNVEDATYHGCAALSDGSVKCWQTDAAAGNARAQLGNGAATPTPALYRATAVVTAPGTPLVNADSVAAAAPSVWGVIPTASSCALTHDGRLWCWGDLTWLSNGGKPLVSPYAQLITRDGMQPLTHVASVALGVRNACALLSGSPQSIWCWGENGRGELAQGDAVPRQYPTRVTGLTNPTKVLVALTGTFYQNSAVCAQDGGNVRCWGDNAAGAVGTNTSTDPIFNATSVVTQTGSLLAGVTDLQLGHGDFAALRTDGTIWTWGKGFANYAANYGATNVRAIGWAGPPREGGPRFYTTDGLYHAAGTVQPINCNAL
jgi:alpha-tubulin suppressor-like RCC1 family protein